MSETCPGNNFRSTAATVEHASNLLAQPRTVGIHRKTTSDTGNCSGTPHIISIDQAPRTLANGRNNGLNLTRRNRATSDRVIASERVSVHVLTGRIVTVQGVLSRFHPTPPHPTPLCLSPPQSRLRHPISPKHPLISPSSPYPAPSLPSLFLLNSSPKPKWRFSYSHITMG